MDQGYAWLAVATENDAWLQFAQVKRQGRGYVGQQVDDILHSMAKDKRPENRVWAEISRYILKSRIKTEISKPKIKKGAKNQGPIKVPKPVNTESS